MSPRFNKFNWPKRGVTWHRQELHLVVLMILLWVVFSLCRLVFVAEAQVLSSRCILNMKRPVTLKHK